MASGYSLPNMTRDIMLRKQSADLLSGGVKGTKELTGRRSDTSTLVGLAMLQDLNVGLGRMSNGNDTMLNNKGEDLGRNLETFERNRLLHKAGWSSEGTNWSGWVSKPPSQTTFGGSFLNEKRLRKNSKKREANTRKSKKRKKFHKKQGHLSGANTEPLGSKIQCSGKGDINTMVEVNTLDEESSIKLEGKECVAKSAKQPYAGQMCPVVQCSLRKKRMRDHVVHCHLPKCLGDRYSSEELADSSLLQARLNCMTWLSKRLVGSESLEKLMHYADQSCSLPKRVYMRQEHIYAMQVFSKYIGWIFTDAFSVKPLSAPAVMLHWRVLAFVIGKLTPEDLLEFHDLEPKIGRRFFLDNMEPLPTQHKWIKGACLMYESVEDEKNESIESQSYGQADNQSHQSYNFQVSSPSTISSRLYDQQAYVMKESVGSNTTTCKSQDLLPTSDTSAGSKGTIGTDENFEIARVLDTHFHLDWCRAQLFGTVSSAMVEEVMCESGSPQIPVKVTGGLAIFSDPELYPTDFIGNKGWKSAVGIHPRKSVSMLDEHWHWLELALQKDSVVACGDVGLDFTCPRDLWPLQEVVLRRAFQLPLRGRPIILHLDNPSSISDAESYGRLLEVVLDEYPRSRVLVLHDFHGGKNEVRNWTAAYRNCYFSFSSAILTYGDARLAGIREVPSDRLLIESNAPYGYVLDGANFMSSVHLGSVLKTLTEVRNGLYLDVVAHCFLNATKVFGL